MAETNKQNTIYALKNLKFEEEKFNNFLGGIEKSVLESLGENTKTIVYTGVLSNNDSNNDNVINLRNICNNYLDGEVVQKKINGMSDVANSIRKDIRNMHDLMLGQKIEIGSKDNPDFSLEYAVINSNEVADRNLAIVTISMQGYSKKYDKLAQQIFNYAMRLKNS